MDVITQDNTVGKITRSIVRSGIAGNYDIILEMRRVIRHSVEYDLGVKDLASRLLIDNNFDSYSNTEFQLKAIYDFVRSNVVYIQDVAGLVESIKDARKTIADGYGDCDDLTNTVATLVGDLGFENVSIAMARYSQDEQTFSHVYPVVYTDKGERFVLDASLPALYGNTFNKEVPAFEVKEIPIFQQVEGVDTGTLAIFQNLKATTRKFGKTTIEAMPLIGDHLPLGFLAGKAFSTGAQLINYTAGQELSINATATKINQELDAIILDLVNEQVALELARSRALQVAAQISAVENRNVDGLETILASVHSRINFIKNFPEYAKENGIRVLELNPVAMLMTGIAGAGVGAYIVYKVWKERKAVIL